MYIYIYIYIYINVKRSVNQAVGPPGSWPLRSMRRDPAGKWRRDPQVLLNGYESWRVTNDLKGFSLWY